MLSKRQGIPVPDPWACRVGAGTLSGWSSWERALSLHFVSSQAGRLMSCSPICLGRMVLPRSWQLQGRRRSQRDVRRRLQALPRSPFLGTAAALVCTPVRVVPQICTGRMHRGWLSSVCPPQRRLGPSHPPPPRSHPHLGMRMLGRSLTRSRQQQEEQQLRTTSLWDPVPWLFWCPAPYRGAGADAMVPWGWLSAWGRVRQVCHTARGDDGPRNPGGWQNLAAPACAVPLPRAWLPPHYLQRTLLVEAHVAEEPGRALARPGRERNSFQS